MKKSILNVGVALKKGEQKEILGGTPVPSNSIPPGFPAECIEGEVYELPSCNQQQQDLADQGDPYWKCICGNHYFNWNEPDLKELIK